MTPNTETSRHIAARRPWWWLCVGNAMSGFLHWVDKALDQVDANTAHGIKKLRSPHAGDDSNGNSEHAAVTNAPPRDVSDQATTPTATSATPANNSDESVEKIAIDSDSVAAFSCDTSATQPQPPTPLVTRSLYHSSHSHARTFQTNRSK